ncbi:hypothetical protein A6V36_36730 [Paraburkholderia ginsengiterrae]|uniref:HTH cro/C1-type domain-containing protein n=1 Tax=Paraburkholderia ginsengiterrae TaxID=1462993 RepID=A0A1A9MYP4_9BURK|nr:helix-turn-helix transcriptional regulator [Paraburkholderia ginsengiterrae]OAJ52833.1 hypothetical protein A6V37_36545 [Paraburkholderia ginsengiterrae]OAJ54104.1 hypothetical protein A6V36_36730 [Paraburkholderia ginsengiterrae]
MTVVKRSFFIHHAILLDHLGNVTVPADGQVCTRQDYTWRGLARHGRDRLDEHVAGGGAKRRLIPDEIVSAIADGATPTRASREHLGLKQAEIAARMSISQPTRIWNGKRRLRESSREKIAAALGITADQLHIGCVVVVGVTLNASAGFIDGQPA